MQNFKRYESINIVQQLKDGDRHAFEWIYNEHAPALLRHVYLRVRDHELSEEIVHDIYLSLWRRRNELDTEMDLKAYLFAAAKYQVLNHFRSEKTHKKYVEHLALFSLQNTDGQIEQSLYAKELAEVIKGYLDKLPDKCKQAFYMSRFEHKSIEEIAKEMGISTRTVENYLTRALKYLREVLAKYSWLIIMAGGIAV